MLLLAYDTKESSVTVEEQIVSKKDDMTKYGDIILPLNKEDGHEPPLMWPMNKQRGIKRKEKVIDFGVKFARSYSTRGSEKKVVN